MPACGVFVEDFWLAGTFRLAAAACALSLARLMSNERAPCVGLRLNNSCYGAGKLVVRISFHWHRSGGPTQHDGPFTQNGEADRVMQGDWVGA